MLVWIKGGGDLATGTAHRLHRAGFSVIVTELPEPLAIRRAVAFASAAFDGSCEVEGVCAVRCHSVEDIRRCLEKHNIPVVTDPTGRIIETLHPVAIIDARMAKRNLGTNIGDAAIVIGLGPGFTAGIDVHAVIETMRGHDLGRVILQGSAEPDTRVPGAVAGVQEERVLRAPCSGILHAHTRIGQAVACGEVVASVAEQVVIAQTAGVIRGLLHTGFSVVTDQKIGDVDPRGESRYCFTISDKSRAVGGAVLEALMALGATKSEFQCVLGKGCAHGNS